ncbi:hypothetical protein [Mesorhizobium sp. ANAO-SY3R2]|uniref:hypothetical protein n=1 Tax=Mesorhizobium sp. ANAO-SY3R2 TaxID=3166644 RepID=UPI00366E0480
MKPDPFDEVGRLIETANRPFPVTLARRQILRAASRAPVTSELADAVDRLNRAILALAEVIDTIRTDPVYARHDALCALARLRILCRGG